MSWLWVTAALVVAVASCGKITPVTTDGGKDTAGGGGSGGTTTGAGGSAGAGGIAGGGGSSGGSGGVGGSGGATGGSGGAGGSKGGAGGGAAGAGGGAGGAMGGSGGSVMDAAVEVGSSDAGSSDAMTCPAGSHEVNCPAIRCTLLCLYGDARGTDGCPTCTCRAAATCAAANVLCLRCPFGYRKPPSTCASGRSCECEYPPAGCAAD